MVSIKSAFIASAFVISAVNAADVTPEQNADLLVIIDDIQSHASDYISLQTSDSGFQVPAQVLSLYAALATYTDESFTTLFSELDVSALTATVTNLPWYSTRLLPALEKANSQFSSNSSSADTTDSSSSNSTVAVSSVGNSTVASSSASVSRNATGSITASGNVTAEETGVAGRNSSSIRRTSSTHSSSDKRNSTESTKSSTKKEKNGAEYIGSSSGLLFAGLAALLL